MKRLLLVLLATGCSKSEPHGQTDPGVTPKVLDKPDITVEIASVTLAEDCADGTPTKPLPPPAGKGTAMGSSSAPADARSMSAGACAPGVHCGGIPQPACEQSSMQLAIHVPAGADEATIQVGKVELLDDAGKPVGELVARTPSKWDGRMYSPWDVGDIAPGKSEVVASYKLTAPDWNKLTNGRWNAPSKRFSLRVTVAIGSRQRTVEKKLITPTTPEPSVST